MSIYNWIQKVFFETYEEWHMKDPNYDRNGFHIIGIDNSLKATLTGSSARKLHVFITLKVFINMARIINET